MLPKNERLTRAEFSVFVKTGRRYHSPSFTLIHIPNESLHCSVVVSKKVAKIAVRRNKLRRRIYDIVRRLRSESGIHGVFIFITKPQAIAREYDELRREIIECISHINTKTR